MANDLKVNEKRQFFESFYFFLCNIILGGELKLLGDLILNAFR